VGAGGLFFFAAWLRESERRVRSAAVLVLCFAQISLAASIPAG
jgi:hypothetical protein